MVQVIRISTVDGVGVDLHGLSVAVCPSIEDAKKTILKDINENFDGKWGSLKEACDELQESIKCHWDEFNFAWGDGGKGATYTICEVENLDYFQLQHTFRLL